MKDKIKSKIKELEETYDYWLKAYDREELEYQEKRLELIRAKINVLKELLEEDGE